MVMDDKTTLKGTW